MKRWRHPATHSLNWLPFVRDNKMKTIALISLLLLLIVADGYCAESGGEIGAAMSEITCNFKIPSEWRKVNNNLYTLRHFGKTLKEWDKFLSEGHQPWRLEPMNVAAACLWEFGIDDNSHDIFKFADRLTEIKENRLYMLKAGTRSYYVYVRMSKAIPIAYRLAIIGN